MTADISPFNPLDKRNLGASVAEALLASRPYPLADLPPFAGAGIYSIYYHGAFSAYAEISCRNQVDMTAPIYVGKAVHEGARKGGKQGSDRVGKPLLKRLTEHAASIDAAENLDLADFSCRFLVVDDIWIPLGEALLIAHFSPLWNSLVDGFGNHNPGRGRHGGMRPRWDVLHPGRSWASACQPRTETIEDIECDVVTFLRTAPFPKSDRFISPGD